MNNVKTFNEIFAEYFEIGSLTPSDQKKYYLIEKYWDKISTRLKDEHSSLRKEAKETFNRMLLDCINSPNSLVAKIAKDTPSWTGNSYVLPIKFKVPNETK